MSEFGDFFRHCPGCGRRFHIKLVGEELVDERKVSGQIRQPMVPPMAASSSYGYGGFPMPPVEVEEGVPVMIDFKDFQYTYRCKHCGHVWSEMREKESKT
jgi:hypothetical protein